MTQSPPEELLGEKMIAARSIPAEIRKRMSPNQFATVQPKQIPQMDAAGWVLDMRNRRSVRMRKPKPHDIAFEDKVWAAFAKLQFSSLNKDRAFEIRYGKSPDEVQHFDVFAADEEVVLVVVCRSSETVRTSQFKREIEVINARRPGLLLELKKEFPSHKVKFILATNNFGMSNQVANQVRDSQIVHMDEEVIDYYIGLADHLGAAARYQLLGNLFAGLRIPNLDPKVVAIEAHIGGHRYYSFSIEPERLLKLAYILHRNNANKDLMPTYQRLIKKTRLKGVAQFVENGGYFPNSLILSMDTGAKGPRFDPFPRHVGKTRAGILHLPQTFRAAYIIDGQHRLYGYADSDRAASDLIPVVAFANLQKPDQVKLFMQINENQQAVPKNLRNTLNADLLWHSPDLREQIKALKLQIAQELGENKISPLYGRVIVGESSKSATRCLTIDAIGRGVGGGNFLGQFTKTEVKSQGTFYRGSNDATHGPLFEFLVRGIGYFKEGLEVQFQLGSAEGGFVFINTGVESLIRILSDVVDHLAVINGYNPRDIAPTELFDAATTYLDPVIAMLGSLDASQGLEFRRMYGSGASTKYWRRMQQAINTAHPDFNPPRLAEWLADEAKEYNQEAQDMITNLEAFLKTDIRDRLREEYGASWFKDGVPRKLQVDAGMLAAERNVDRPIDDQLEPWDCLYIVDYQAIMTLSQNVWKSLFEKRYTRPGDENRPGSWRARSGWLLELNDVRNDVFHGRSVSEEHHGFLVALTAWLIKGQEDNDI
jgi:DNA sulfur modification protein DndB